ncbi:hypothetical protein F753_03755, partial [Stutzerimonas chloritidismutans AW-1]
IRKRGEPLPVVSARFVPVPLGFLPAGRTGSEELTIRIEIPYHAGSLSVHWPVEDGEGCARLLRGLLA